MLRQTAVIVALAAVAAGAQSRQTAPPRPPVPRVPLTMFVPLAHVRFFGSAELWLQNRGADAQPVTLHWTVEGGGRVPGPVVTLEPYGVQFLDVAALLPSDASLGTVTALEMRYQGRRATEVLAWMTFHPAAGATFSQALDVPVSIPEDVNGPTLDTVWPAPRGNERVVIALINTGAEPLSVNVLQQGRSEVVKLGAFGSHLLNRSASGGPGRAEWVRLETVGGGPNRLRAAGFVRSADDRIPHLLRFHDASDAVTEDLFATGVRARGTKMTMALANVSDIAHSATASLFDQTGGPALARILVALPARSVQLVDVSAHLTSEPASGTVAIRIDGDGPRGSLLGNLQAVDRGTGLGFEASFSDVLTPRGSAGTYVWRLDGDYEASFSVTNFGTAGSFTLYNRSGADQYAYGVQKIGAGATYAVDLRGFRDSDRIDASPRRRAMPRDVLFGQLHWSRAGSGSDMGLLGRLEIVSRQRRVVRSISDQ